MRHRARTLPAALACLLAVSGCAGGSDDVRPERGAAATPATSATEPLTTIPDDFPLAAGMGAPEDQVATTRSGTGLRVLELCGETPLRGLGLRDRMVADNSGGEAADTREIVLLGSPGEARDVATTLRDLATDCDRPRSGTDVSTRTDVLASPFGPAPAGALLQTYVFDGQPGDGSTLVHVVPAGAALLVTSTYGDWTRAEADRAVAQTADHLRDTVAALDLFDDGEAS